MSSTVRSVLYYVIAVYICLQLFLQVAYGEGNPGVAIETNELTHGLVIALEALFIHGLKKHSTRAVKASSLRNLPGPSFWTFVLVFSHKETISHLEKLTAITTGQLISE
jgi:hypothetical protein